MLGGVPRRSTTLLATRGQSRHRWGARVRRATQDLAIPGLAIPGLATLAAMVLALPFGLVFPAIAGGPSGEDLERAGEYFREVDELCRADGGQLWGVSLAGPVMIVDPATRVVFANHADAEGQLKQEGNVFVGTLPANVPIANTASSGRAPCGRN